MRFIFGSFFPADSFGFTWQYFLFEYVFQQRKLNQAIMCVFMFRFRIVWHWKEKVGKSNKRRVGGSAMINRQFAFTNKIDINITPVYHMYTVYSGSSKPNDFLSITHVLPHSHFARPWEQQHGLLCRLAFANRKDKRLRWVRLGCIAWQTWSARQCVGLRD